MPMMDPPSEGTGSTPAKAATVTSPEVKATPLSSHNLSLVPQQSTVLSWLVAEAKRADVPGTRHAQHQMPQTKADSRPICPLSGEPFEQPMKNQSRRIYADAGVSEKKPSAAGTSPDPKPHRQSLAQLLDASLEAILLPTKTSDTPDAPSTADEKPQKAKQRQASRPRAKNAPVVSATQSGSSEPSAEVDLEQRVRKLTISAENVAFQAQLEKDIPRQQDLTMELSKLESAFLEYEKQLRGQKMKEIRAQVPKGGRADQVQLAAENTSLLAQRLQRQPPVQEQSPSNKPVDQPQSARQELEAAFGHKIHGPDGDKLSKPSASAQEKPSRPEAHEVPETEWTDIKLEDAEEPLGQEEWEDDIKPETIPRAAAHNPQYPNLTF